MKKKKFLSSLLVFAMMANCILVTPINAQAIDSTLKTKTITLSSSANQARGTVVNIPNLRKVESLTSDTGTASYSISGDNVTIAVDGGTSNGTQWNPYKFLQMATKTITSMSNNLPSTYDYSDGTYSGAISGLGVTTSTVQTGGSYTAPITMWATAVGNSYSSLAAVPSTYAYNQGGYVGTLAGQGINQLLVSGSTGPSNTISVTYDTPTIYMGSGFVSDLLGHPSYSTYYYNVDGYVGTIPVTGYQQWQYNNYAPSGHYCQIAGYLKYAGNVTRPAFDNRVWSYSQTYSGNVTKPASDTRTYATQYAQNYSGTVYAGSNEPTYSYTLTLSYYEDIMELEIDSGTLGLDPANAANLDDLSNWDLAQPVDFNPTTIGNKTVKLSDKYFHLTKKKVEKLGNTSDNPIAAKFYAISKDGYGYSDWESLDPNGILSVDIYFNQPGVYLSRIKFKNFSAESDPIDKSYFVDWIKPTIDVQSKMRGQMATTEDTYSATLTATDNMSPYLFYTTDKVNWYLLEEGTNDITFTNIEKSTKGTLNKLTVTVSDLCGNTSDQTFSVWGIQK